MTDVAADIAQIKERNERVEADKAWETSATRILSIALMTYVIAVVAFMAMGNEHPFRNALIPVIGFFLSTQSLPFLKKAWIASYLKRRAQV